MDVRLEGPPLPRPLRVAIVPTPEGPEVHPSVSKAIQTAGAYLADAGYEVTAAAPSDLSRAAELWHELAIPNVFGALQPRMEELGDEDSKRSMQLWVDAYERGDFDRSSRARSNATR